MNVFEYTEDEAALRSRLEDELGTLAPSAVPMDAILSEGRGIRRRRRRSWGVAGLASVVVLGLAAGVLGSAVHSRISAAGPHPSVSPRATHTVKVNPAAQDAANGMIGSGSVDGVAWSVAYQPGGAFLEHLGPGTPVMPTRVASGAEKLGHQAPLSDPLSDLSSPAQPSADVPDSRFGFYVGDVPSPVSRLVLALDDGEAVTVPAESSSISSRHQRYVAFVIPAGLGIDRITAYTDSGAELGYSIPFNGSGFPIIASWYPKGKTPSTSAPGSGTASGSVSGSAWSFTAWTGQFGVCYAFTMLPGYTGTVDCTGQFVPSVKAVDFPLQQPSKDVDEIVYGALNPAVAKVAILLSDGRIVMPKLVRAGAVSYYVDVYPPGTEFAEITTYDARGHLLAQAQR